MPKFTIPEDMALKMGLPRPCVITGLYKIPKLRRVMNKQKRKKHVGMSLWRTLVTSSRLRFRIRTKEVEVPPEQVSALLAQGIDVFTRPAGTYGAGATYRFVPIVEMQEEGDNENVHIGEHDEFKIQDSTTGVEEPIKGKTELEVNQMMFNSLGNAYSNTRDSAVDITPPTEYELIDGVQVVEPGDTAWIKMMRHPYMIESMKLGGFWKKLWGKIKTVVTKVGGVIKQAVSGVAKAAIGLLPGPIGKPLEKLRSKYLGDSKISNFISNVAKKGFSLIGLQQRSTSSGEGEGSLGAAQGVTINGALYIRTAMELMENYDELPIGMNRTWGSLTDDEDPMEGAYTELVGTTSEYEEQPGSGEEPAKPTESFDNTINIPTLKARCYDDAGAPYKLVTYISGAFVSITGSFKLKTAINATEMFVSEGMTPDQVGKLCPANSRLPNETTPYTYQFFTPCHQKPSGGNFPTTPSSELLIEFYPKWTVGDVPTPLIRISFPVAVPAEATILFNATYCQDQDALSATVVTGIPFEAVNPFKARPSIMQRYRNWAAENELKDEKDRAVATPSFNTLETGEGHYLPESVFEESKPPKKKE